MLTTTGKKRKLLLGIVVLAIAVGGWLLSSRYANRSQSELTQVKGHLNRERRTLRSGNNTRAADLETRPVNGQWHGNKTDNQPAITPAPPIHRGHSHGGRGGQLKSAQSYKNSSTADRLGATEVTTPKRVFKHRMIQFNVDSGGGKRLPLLMQWIRKQKVDVVGLNELNGWDSEDDEEGTMIRANRSGFRHAHVMRIPSGYNLGIMSVWPLTVVEERLNGFQRGVLHVRIGKHRHIFIVHLHAHEAIKRLKEAKRLVSMVRTVLQNDTQACVSITGDFNTLSPLDHARHTREALLQRLRKCECTSSTVIHVGSHRTDTTPEASHRVDDVTVGKRVPWPHGVDAATCVPFSFRERFNISWRRTANPSPDGSVGWIVVHRSDKDKGWTQDLRLACKVCRLTHLGRKFLINGQLGYAPMQVLLDAGLHDASCHPGGDSGSGHPSVDCAPTEPTAVAYDMAEDDVPPIRLDYALVSEGCAGRTVTAGAGFRCGVVNNSKTNYLSDHFPLVCNATRVWDRP